MGVQPTKPPARDPVFTQNSGGSSSRYKNKFCSQTINEVLAA
jgi:hypothetical protein